MATWTTSSQDSNPWRVVHDVLLRGIRSGTDDDRIGGRVRSGQSGLGQ